MKEVKVVIGANYGDEGKGLMTNYFARKAIKQDKKCLNILFNGGAQRGHTVENGDFRHVFHAFGAASYQNVDTFYNRHFMVNPFIFLSEKKELEELNVNQGRTWVDWDCEITTPYDILFNQALEQSRGKNRHGSCGCGIFETFNRINEGFHLTCKDLFMSFGELYSKIKFIRDKYFAEKRMKEVDTIFAIDWRKDFFSEVTLINFVKDLMEFKKSVYFSSLNKILDYYDTLIFEGGQGLALDMDNKKDFPHLTPSHTGSDWVIEQLRELDETFDVEVCYVTRSYFTRHGAGILKREVKDFHELGIKDADKTNVKNNWQGSIRYAPFNLKECSQRCLEDAKKWVEEEKTRHFKVSQSFTHLNEFLLFKELGTSLFPHVYFSFSPDFDEVVYIHK